MFSRSASKLAVFWRDAMLGARWGLEYPELSEVFWLRASELTSQRYFIRRDGKTVFA